MKKFTIKNLQYIPAGHENSQNPGALKKVIFTINDLKIEGTIQMVNWSKIETGKSFARHYHEYMDEIFIIVSGQAEIMIGQETALLEATDTVYIPQQTEHKMKNTGSENLEYIALGIITKPDGKTIVTETIVASRN